LNITSLLKECESVFLLHILKIRFRVMDFGMSGLTPCLRNGAQKDQSTQSIMKTLNNFLNAYKTMQSTVMFPSKLKDISISVTPVTLNGNGGLPSASSAMAPVEAEKQKADLYNCFKMLETVHNELVGQRMTDLNNNIVTEVDLPPDEQQEEPSETMASAFRTHLQSLFNILHQLTDTANVLSKKYQDNIEQPDN